MGSGAIGTAAYQWSSKYRLEVREQTIALKTRRRIPDLMLPAVTGRKTIEAHLDRRWFTGVTPQPKGAARKKLDAWESAPFCDGYAWRGGEAAVIGVPIAAV